jgi:hypothetical protein
MKWLFAHVTFYLIFFLQHSTLRCYGKRKLRNFKALAHCYKTSVYTNRQTTEGRPHSCYVYAYITRIGYCRYHVYGILLSDSWKAYNNSEFSASIMLGIAPLYELIIPSSGDWWSWYWCISLSEIRQLLRNIKSGSNHTVVGTLNQDLTIQWLTI